MIIVRCCLCVLVFGGFLVYRFLYTNEEVDCIKDAYQDLTEGWNRKMVIYPDRGGSWEGKDDNPLSITGKVLIGIGQVIMDIFITLTAIIW